MIDLSGDSAVFLADFGEGVLYTPHGGVQKNISAIVERSPIRATDHAGKKTAQGIFEVFIANDATLGVTEIKEGFDKVTIAERIGGAVEKVLRVTKILEQDPGMWHLECGA